MAEFMENLAADGGHVSEQLEHGYSVDEVRERVSQQGYLVYSVKPRGIFSPGSGLGRGRIRQSSFLVFNQQFLTLIRAGLPIMTGLELLIKRQKDASLKAVLENVRERVKGGELLSDAFAAQNMFPKMYTTTLMAGEKSGNMEEVLGRYIAFQRIAMTFRKKLLVSLVYPTLLVTVVLIMVVFLVTYVVPEFAKLFENLGAKLPTITVFMLAVGTAAQKYVLFFAAGLAAFIFLLWRWKNTDQGAETIDRVLMAVPLLGDIRMKYQVASLSRMLSTLLQGGIPLVPAMEKAGGAKDSRNLPDRRPRAKKPGARRAGFGEEPRGAAHFPGPGGGDDGSRRIDGRFAGNAEFGGGILRGRCADGTRRGHGVDRADPADFHGDLRRWSFDFALPADLYVGSWRSLGPLAMVGSSMGNRASCQKVDGHFGNGGKETIF